MKRVYTSYSETELEAIKKTSREWGMDITSFLKYCVLLQIGLKDKQDIKKDKIDLDDLTEQMKKKLRKMKAGETFIVSALFSPQDWTSLSRSQKITLSLRLKDIIESDSNRFEVAGLIRKTIKQYRCLY